MILDIVQSVALYLQQTPSVDPVTRVGQAENLNLARRVDCAPLASPVTAGAAAALVDGLSATGSPIVTVGSGSGAPIYVGLSWPTAQDIDALVYTDLPGGESGAVVKVQTSSNGSAWTDVSNWTYTLLSGQDTILHLPKAVTTKYIRVLYVSGGSPTNALDCAELAAYSVEAQLLAPTGWSTMQYLVLHPSVRADLPDPSAPLLTVEGIETLKDDVSLGGDAIDEHATVWVTVYAAATDPHPEDTAQRYARWVRLLLDTALALDTAGKTWAGLQIYGIQVPLEYETEDTTTSGRGHVASGTNQAWWASRQRNWLQVDAFGASPEIYRNGSVVTADATDYVRGRVQVTAASSTDSIRATFACGVWDFTCTQEWAGRPEGIEAVRERHGVAFRLEARPMRRALWNAIA